MAHSILAYDTPIDALGIASMLASATTDSAFELFEDLREEGRLCETIRGLNRLLQNSEHHDMALAALRSIGLEHAG